MTVDQTFDPLAVDWAWSEFGGELMLVTDGSGCKVVIGTVRKGRIGVQMATRDAKTGTLRAIKPADPIAVAIAAVPEMIRALQGAVIALSTLGIPDAIACSDATRAALSKRLEAAKAVLQKVRP